jgi:hypothetical protein
MRHEFQIMRWDVAAGVAFTGEFTYTIFFFYNLGDMSAKGGEEFRSFEKVVPIREAAMTVDHR